jgi:hypothetical protein
MSSEACVYTGENCEINSHAGVRIEESDMLACEVAWSAMTSVVSSSGEHGRRAFSAQSQRLASYCQNVLDEPHFLSTDCIAERYLDP